MIIFDTSELFGSIRDNSKFDFLRALRYSDSEQAGIPWIVREELVAQQVIRYRDAHGQAESAINQLNRRIFWPATAAVLPPLNIERAKQYWRSQYEEFLEILETSGESARAALAREAFREKPAKAVSKDKGGARDAAIWLSVIDYLRAHPTETVHFVTSNTKDFGNGTAYDSPMSEDLGDMGPRLVQLTSFDNCVSLFSTPIEVDVEEARQLLSHLSGTSLMPITTAAHISLRGGRFEGTRIDGPFEAFHWASWLLPPSAIVRNVSEASGHRIGDSEWYTAAVDWILVGIAQPAGPIYGSRGDISAVVQTACQWQTKVLFSTAQYPKLAIVDFQVPKALEPNDRPELEPLIAQGVTSQPQSESLLGAYFAQLLDSLPTNEFNPDVIFNDENLDQPPDL